MTSPPSTAVVAAAAIIVAFLFPFQPPSVNALGGSSTTVAVSYGSATTVCSLVADQPTQQIQCWRNGQVFSSIYAPTVSFDSIAGGLDIVCAIRSGGISLLCWSVPSFTPKRLYLAGSTLLTSVTVGDTQICALTNGTQGVSCWRGDSYSAISPNGTAKFSSISSGLGFSCGVLEDSGKIACWGSSESTSAVASDIEFQFANISMANIFVGGRHACGINTSGIVICRGNNSNGQLDVPSNSSFEYSGLALGANHSCAIRSLNNTVVCWGGNGEYSSNVTEVLSFESIVAGLDFTCGLVTSNFSVICWGPGWPNNLFPAATGLPLQRTLPGPCVQSACRCGIYPQSQTLCSGNGNICRPCDIENSSPPASPPLQPSFPSPSPSPPLGHPPPSSPSRALRRGLLAFAIVGSVGGFAGICTIIYCLWAGVCFGKKKIHNSVQPTITNNNVPQQSNSSPPSRSSTLRRQGSRLMRRQRSGTSSTKHPDRAEEFLFQDLAAATKNFSLENKIGAGSFGVVYKGKLLDGRVV